MPRKPTQLQEKRARIRRQMLRGERVTDAPVFRGGSVVNLDEFDVLYRKKQGDYMTRHPEKYRKSSAWEETKRGIRDEYRRLREKF